MAGVLSIVTLKNHLKSNLLKKLTSDDPIKMAPSQRHPSTSSIFFLNLPTNRLPTTLAVPQFIPKVAKRCSSQKVELRLLKLKLGQVQVLGGPSRPALALGQGCVQRWTELRRPRERQLELGRRERRRWARGPGMCIKAHHRHTSTILSQMQKNTQKTA